MMKPTVPSIVLSDAALDALATATAPLRKEGWDVKLSVERASKDEDHFFEVTAKIKVGHSMPIPIEAR